MIYSFLGKAEEGKELCSGGETLLKGGKSQGAPPSVCITDWFIMHDSFVFIFKISGMNLA